MSRDKGKQIDKGGEVGRSTGKSNRRVQHGRGCYVAMEWNVLRYAGKVLSRMFMEL